ncbi:unnamed protein product [Macrosiphum euphorbiae]|uniref:Transposase n=1 Tax=Macrosiphum euphorbiae TaxID=13131 RepID=A0AAV0X205_9HEMI|nr:unnamed protein product [Macrosiphum euphorbiae]
MKDKVDDFDKHAIRRKIQKCWSDSELPTFEKVMKVVNEDEDLPYYSSISLYRLLKSMDFVYVKHGRSSALIEKNEMVDWRRRYLRAIRRYRDEGRPIYYLDETWVNAGDVPYKVSCDKLVLYQDA